jgi:hypothetical protein
MLLALALVFVRVWPHAWWGTMAFDADQAVVGLMAKHVAELRAFPVYQYALPYVLMVTAYLTAPFMWVLGATPFALKLPLAVLNAIVGLGLVLALLRVGLRPAVAVLLSLPVLMTGGIATAGLMDALGMTIEPLAFVLALWFLRGSPVAFGVVAAVGFHVREFVAYAVAAALCLDALTGALLRAEGRRAWGGSAIAAAGVSAAIAGLARFGSVRGPHTAAFSTEGNLATLSGAFCFAPAQAMSNLISLPSSYLGMLWGAAPMPLSEAAVQTTISQGLPGAWPLLGAVLAMATGVIVLRWRVLWARRHRPDAQLAAFLILVGLQSVVVYAVSRCGPLSVITVRYALLGLYLPTGVALALWTVEPGAVARRAVGLALVALAAVNAWPHLHLWHQQLTRPVLSNRALLGPALEQRGLRYVRSDYWTAYYVAFITQERVTVGADTLSRVDEYERILARHASEVVRVSTTPCDGRPPIVPGYHLCRDLTP